MNEDKKFTSFCRYDNNYPQEYVNHAIKYANRELAESLFDFLYDNKRKYVCVFIDTKSERFYDHEEYTVSAEVREVQSYSYRVAVMNYEDMSWKQLSQSAIGEVKTRIRGWFRSAK